MVNARNLLILHSLQLQVKLAIAVHKPLVTKEVLSHDLPIVHRLAVLSHTLQVSSKLLIIHVQLEDFALEVSSLTHHALVHLLDHLL